MIAARGAQVILIGTGLVIGAVVLYKLAKSGVAAADTVKKSVTEVVNAINPANPDNIVNRQLTQVVQTLTGGPDTLGTWLAGKLDPASRQAERDAAALNQPSPGGAKPKPSQSAALSQFDLDDAEEGAIIAANARGLSFVGQADLDDAEMGAQFSRAAAERPYLDYSHLLGRAPR